MFEAHTHNIVAVLPCVYLCVCLCLCVSLLHQRFCRVSSFINSQNKNSCNSWRVLVFFLGVDEALTIISGMGYFGFVQNLGYYANGRNRKKNSSINFDSNLFYLSAFDRMFCLWHGSRIEQGQKSWNTKKITLFFCPSSRRFFFFVCKQMKSHSDLI